MAPILELILPVLLNAVMQSVPALVKQWADPHAPDPVPPSAADPHVAEAISTIATAIAQHIAAQAWQASQDRPHATRQYDLEVKQHLPPIPDSNTP